MSAVLDTRPVRAAIEAARPLEVVASWRVLPGALMVLGGRTLWAAGLEGIDEPALTSVGFIVALLPFAAVVHLMLAFPSGFLRSRAERLLVAATYTAMLGLVALLALYGLFRAYLSDGERRVEEAERQRADAVRMEQDAKRTNDQNQAAILRLMNELQEVADGDLTVQATVSEDITGAIADSVNYTVEELRDLLPLMGRDRAAERLRLAAA